MKVFNNYLEKLNFNMEEIRLFDSFAGIGALHQSLKSLGVPVKLVGMSEIDIDAIISYGAIHGYLNMELDISNITQEEMKSYLIDRNIGFDFKTNKSKVPKLNKIKLMQCYKICVLCNNYGDISKIKYDNIDDFDLFNFSFPCTDISIAGKQNGFIDENGDKTRSGLYVDGIELIKVKKPKYIMIENVKNLVSKKFINGFYGIIDEIEKLGYKCYYKTDSAGNPKCLNAKNYGIPQNRERIFVIGVRNDVKINNFEFPIGFDNGIRLKDILEDEVEEKYYINTEKAEKLINEYKGGLAIAHPIRSREFEGQGWKEICPTLCARDYKDPKNVIIKTSKRIGGLFDTEKSKHQAGSIWDTEGLAPTIDTMQGGYRQPCIVGSEYKIRKLTPKECWRLMGFGDEQFNKASEVCSNSQLYKQAGNSIVVNVLYYIFKELFKNNIID